MMNLCPKCGRIMDNDNYCDTCHYDVTLYTRMLHTSNYLYNKGLNLAQLRDLSGAIEVLHKSLKFNKYHTDARNLLGLIYYEIGETVLALRQWVISKNLDNNNNDAIVYLESIQTNQSHLDKLNAAVIKYNQSIRYFKQNSVDLAIIHLKKIISMHPNYVNAYVLLGLCYMKEGNNKKAIRTIKKAIEIDKGHYLARRYLNELEADIALTSEAQNDEVVDTPIMTRDIHMSPVVSYAQQLGILVVGVIVGLAVALFLVAPSNIKKVEAQIEDVRAELVKTEQALNEKSAQYDQEKKQRDQLEKENSEINNILEREKNQGTEYEKLILASSLYDSGDFVGAGEQLYLFDENKISNIQIRNFATSYKGTVATKLYELGRQQYFIRSSTSYGKAIVYFDVVRKIGEDADYSLEALYYKGVSHYQRGEKESALADFKEYVDNYPEGKRFKDASWYMGKLQ